jgi:hypothetical protein
MNNSASQLALITQSKKFRPSNEDPAMERMTVAEVERDFGRLVNRVHSEGISIELEQGEKGRRSSYSGRSLVATKGSRLECVPSKPSGIG